MVVMRDVQRSFGSGSMKNLSRACEVVPLVSALARFGIASKEQARALKRRGQNTENNLGWTSKGRLREASGMFATIDDSLIGRGLA
jgi:hypothetical protein